MKKIFTFIVAASLLTAGSMSASNAGLKDFSKSEIQAKQKKSKQHFAEHAKVANRISTRDLPHTDVILNPEGEYKIYTKSTVGMEFGSPYDGDFASTVVFGENNVVYFGDILSFYGYGTYIKGEIVGNEIVVPLPQSIYWDDMFEYGLNLCLLKDDGSGDYELTNVDSVSFEYDAATGEINLDLPGEAEEYLLGAVWTDDESWAGDGDFVQTYVPFEGDVTVMPENTNPVEYVYNDGYFGEKVYVAFVDDKVYIKGLSASVPEGTIYGVVNGNEVSIPNEQYVGTYVGYFIWVRNLELDNDYNFTFSDSEYKLILDKEANTLKSADADAILGFNAEGDDPGMVLDYFNDFEIYIQKEFDGVPNNPFGLDFYDDYYDYYGMYEFSFYIPNVGTNNNVLDSDDLYYRVFVDGELFEFEEDEDIFSYMGLQGVTEIPFEFDNGFDAGKYSPTQRYVGLYIDGISTVGVQTVYKYDGVVTESAIMTLDIDTGEVTETPAGISSIFDNEVKSKVYYDLNGRKVSNPEKGIYIMRATKADGSVVNKKVVVK